MYQCRFFYQEDRRGSGPLHVLSAFSVTADPFYHYDTEKGEDALYHPEGTMALIRTREGRGRMKLRSGETLLEKDTFWLVPLSDIIRYQAGGDFWSYYWINFTPDPSKIRPLPVRGFPFTEYEREILDELLRAGEEGMGSDYVDGIFHHVLFRLFCGKWSFPIKKEKPETGEAIRSYIDQKYFYRLRVSEIADFFSLSTRKLNQIFQEEFHLSPKQYILKKKMERARELLAGTDLRIGEIAASLSFDSAYHFSNTFKKEIGVPPSAYRREKRNR